MSCAALTRLLRLIGIACVLACAGGCIALLALLGGNGAAQASRVAGGNDRRAPIAAAAKAPPVIDGVRRFNVGFAHSPQLSRALSRGPATAASTLRSGTLLRGIDVARHQHPHGAAINWARVAQVGYKFAFVKASEGNYYVNPYYASDLAQAAAAGLFVSGYHFAVPNVSSGASQARYAVRSAHYDADGRTMPLVLDIEYNPYGRMCYGFKPARMVAWISAFTSEVRRLTGQRPIIYTAAKWWRTCTADSSAFSRDPLWIAAWEPGPAPLPSGWRQWTFWQYTSRGHVPGIDGKADVSYFGPAVVRLLDPGPQHTAARSAVRLRVRSLNAAAGRPPAFTATGLPRGLSISGRGLITGTVSRSAKGGHAVTVTGRIPSGGRGSVTFTWKVLRPRAGAHPPASTTQGNSPHRR